MGGLQGSSSDEIIRSPSSSIAGGETGRSLKLFIHFKPSSGIRYVGTPAFHGTLCIEVASSLDLILGQTSWTTCSEYSNAESCVDCLSREAPLEQTTAAPLQTLLARHVAAPPCVCTIICLHMEREPHRGGRATSISSVTIDLSNFREYTIWAFSEFGLPTLLISPLHLLQPLPLNLPTNRLG